jgi:hypothetical protein
VKRSKYEKLRGFRLDLFHVADWEMWQRIAYFCDYWYEPEILACFCIHSESDTSKLERSGKDLHDIRNSIEIASTYLPPGVTKKV